VTRRIRVLHAVLDLDAGGLERLVAQMVTRGDHATFEYHVLGLRFLGRFAEGLERYAKLHVGAPMGRGSLFWPAALGRQLRAIAPDVIHSHSGVWLKSARALRWLERPWLIHTDHGRRRPDPWQDRLVDRLASRRTDVVVAVSEVLAQQLRSTVVAFPDRVRVILNGVDTDEFQPHPDDGVLRRELGLSPGTPIIGSTGRLEPIKGYDIVVEAFGVLAGRWTGPDAPVLVVGGEGTVLEELRARLEVLGLAGRAHLLGWRQDLASMYRAFALFTMGSRSEGTSVSLLEAMSAGLCPVVPNVGGNPAVLGPELAHRLVRPLDPKALASGWEEALRNPERRQADAAQARRRVETTFSLTAMVRGYEALYREGVAFRDRGMAESSPNPRLEMARSRAAGLELP